MRVFNLHKSCKNFDNLYLDIFTIVNWDLLQVWRIACRGESTNPFTSNISTLWLERLGILTGNTVNNFHAELCLGSWIWWCRFKSPEYQNKLPAYLLIFKQVTSLLHIFGRLVGHFILKPPVKWNSNVDINQFANYYLQKFERWMVIVK